MVLAHGCGLVGGEEGNLDISDLPKNRNEWIPRGSTSG